MSGQKPFDLERVRVQYYKIFFKCLRKRQLTASVGKVSMYGALYLIQIGPEVTENYAKKNILIE